MVTMGAPSHEAEGDAHDCEQSMFAVVILPNF